MPKEEYDVAIIGAGISGLLAGAILSKLGLRVVVLEKQYELGGYLQGFKRKEFIFDTAIHWLNQCGPHGTVTRVFGLLGNDFPKAQPMRYIQKHVGDSHSYVLTDNPDELKNQLIADFPHETEGIEQFFKVCRRIAKVSLRFDEFFQSIETMPVWYLPLFRMKQLSLIYPLIPYAMYAGDDGVKKGLSRWFKDPELLQLFCAERDLLSCIFPIAWAYNHDYQNPPIGGSQAFPAWLNQQFEENGGTLKLSALVKAIHVSDNKATGLTYVNRSKEYEINAKFVIASCDVKVLYERLLPPDFATPKVTKSLELAQLYPSSVTVSIALNCTAESLGLGHELIVITKDDNTRDEHYSGDPHKATISVLAPSVRDHTLAPEGKGTLTLYVPAWMEYENNWRTERKANGEFVRTEAYKKLKEQYAQIIIQRVAEKLNIDLLKHIEFYEVATPITYYRYTHNQGGTMMGARPGKENMQNGVAKYKTQLENVIIGGHWAELGGGVPIATKAGYNASLLALQYLNKSKAKHLIKAFREKKEL